MPYDVESPKLRTWREMLTAAEELIESSKATLNNPRADTMMRAIAASNLTWAEGQAAKARQALDSEAAHGT